MNPVDESSGLRDATGGSTGLLVLSRVARILQDEDRPRLALLGEVIDALPGGWQRPGNVRFRIHHGDLDIRTPGFTHSASTQSVRFTTDDGTSGALDVSHLEERPAASDGPFHDEERALATALAELLRSYFQHATTLDAARRARDDLAAEVRLRTAQLDRAKWSLDRQDFEHRQAQERIEKYQRELRKLASELSLAEARQRRVIAQELHDQIGQALAFTRMRVVRLRGDAVFCGFEDTIGEILRLLGQAINSTRSLTFEISPPVLYELGLASALDWLAERLAGAHHIAIEVAADARLDALPDDTRVLLFQAVRELLVNAIKHADPTTVTVTAQLTGDEVRVVVADDGRGFDAGRVRETGVDGMTFGLFSIRERLTYFGGHMVVESGAGRGTSVTLTTPMGQPPSEAER